MATRQLIILDLLVAVVAAATWIGAGVTAVARRTTVATALAGAAVLATLARIGLILALLARGWWFVAEKVTIVVPLLVVTAAVAVVLSGPRLIRLMRESVAGDPPATRVPASVDEMSPASGNVPVTGGAPALDVVGIRVVLPLFVAGYAAVGGLGVSFLAGYGAALPTGLLTVALVAAATLVTWRSLVPAASGTEAIATGGFDTGATNASEVGRGTTVARGVAVASAVVGVVAMVLAFLPADDVDLGSGAATSANSAGVMVSSLHGPDAASLPPDTVVRRYTLTAQRKTLILTSGARMDALTFNGTVPGPAITAEQGDLIEVTLRNADIDDGVTIHWHGYDVPSAEDGAPGLTQDAVAQGGQYVYRFLARQVGTYWYHTHEASDVGVRMGLYGSLVVRPRGSTPAGLELTLPIHTFGAVAVLGDNDQTVLRAVAPGTTVRLRLVNTDNTTHRLALAGAEYRLVAIDGTEVNEPGALTTTALRLAAGGRYDLAFTMPEGGVALLVDDNRGHGLRLTRAGAALTDAADTASWPDLDLIDYGRASSTPFGAGSAFSRHFTLVLDRGIAISGGLPRYAYTLNSRAFPVIPTQQVREGDLVEMTVVNRGLDVHPWHLHGHHVLVLSRDGRPVTGSPLWMDTFEVRPGEVWRIAFRADNPGLWMNHCHNLSHTNRGMMLVLAYEGVTGSTHGAHSG